MSTVACLLAFLAALVFGTPGLDRTVKVDLGVHGASVSLEEAWDASRPGLVLGLARVSVDAERGLRVEMRV